MTSKGQSENFKKMSWDNPVFPRAAKNTIGFFVQFFLSYVTVAGGCVIYMNFGVKFLVSLTYDFGAKNQKYFSLKEYC